MTPDLICVMDSVSGEAIGTETLRYGQRSASWRCPRHPCCSRRRASSTSAPRAFGYDLDFQSVFHDAR